MIGERLADLRKDRGLTQTQLAEKMNLTKTNISAYEREHNEAPDATKIALAKYFHVSVDYLLGLTDLPNAYEPARNSILLNKDFPPAAKAMLQCLVRIISVAYHTNPKAVANELEKLSRVLSSISEETEGGDEGDPGADGF